VVKWGEGAISNPRGGMSPELAAEIQEKRGRMIKTKVAELEYTTKLATSLIERLLNERKIFGTKFIYDGIDYLATIQQEQKMITGISMSVGKRMEKVNHEKAL